MHTLRITSKVYLNDSTQNVDLVLYSINSIQQKIDHSHMHSITFSVLLICFVRRAI